MTMGSNGGWCVVHTEIIRLLKSDRFTSGCLNSTTAFHDCQYFDVNCQRANRAF